MTRAVILVLESTTIIGVSIIANYWIIGSMKFWGEIWLLYLCSLFIQFNIQVLHTHSKCRYNYSALWNMYGCCKFELL